MVGLVEWKISMFLCDSIFSLLSLQYLLAIVQEMQSALIGKAEIQPVSTCNSSGFTRYTDFSDNIDTEGNSISIINFSDSDNSCCAETT